MTTLPVEGCPHTQRKFWEQSDSWVYNYTTSGGFPDSQHKVLGTVERMNVTILLGSLSLALINIASSCDVPFHQLQQLQCLHHSATFIPLWSPILSSQLCKVMICSRHVMASVQDISIAEAFLILSLAYHVMKQVWNCWNWGVMAFTYRDMGAHFTNIFSLFSIIAGWIAEMLFMLILLCNGQNTAEYEVYWCMGVLIIYA